MTRANLIRMPIFLVTALAILTVCGWKIVRNELALRYGNVYTFKIAGYDPYDLARGRYLAFTMPSAARTAANDLNGADSVCVSLSTGADGLAEFDRMSRTPPESGDWIAVSRGRYHYGTNFMAPFSRFYVNEEIATQAEALLRDAQRAGTAAIRLRVYHGIAAIEALLINGQPLSQSLGR